MPDNEPGNPLSENDPERLGPYRLLRRLGSGAMGRVYLAVAQDDPAAEPVAVKLIHEHLADQPLFRRRFTHELAAMRAVRHPRTARLLAADTDAQQPWFASTYIPGPGIDAAVAARGPLPTAEVAVIGVGVAHGLEAMHAARIVHRDLKPANVLLGPDGPVIIDFGIARAADATYLTATGLQVGTFEFMSPEQASGQFVGPPSDVFALGSVLFFAATGRSPFSADTALAIAQLIVTAPPAADAAASIPAGLREVVLSCLEKDPAKRPSLGQLADALTAVIAAEAAGTTSGGGPASQPPLSPSTEFALERVLPSAPPAAEPAPRRHRLTLVSATAAVIAVIATVTVAVLLNGGHLKPHVTALTGNGVSATARSATARSASASAAVTTATVTATATSPTPSPDASATSPTPSPDASATSPTPSPDASADPIATTSSPAHSVVHTTAAAVTTTTKAAQRTVVQTTCATSPSRTECDQKYASAEGCAADAVTVPGGILDATLHGVSFVIELEWSPTCQTNWTVAKPTKGVSTYFADWIEPDRHDATRYFSAWQWQSGWMTSPMAYSDGGTTAAAACLQVAGSQQPYYACTPRLLSDGTNVGNN